MIWKEKTKAIYINNRKMSNKTTTSIDSNNIKKDDNNTAAATTVAVEFEEDEFEEFPIDTWTVKSVDKTKVNEMWGNNWDDDDIRDDFIVQLKKELKQ